MAEHSVNLYILDNLPAYRSLDPSGMLEHIHRLPAQCSAVWQEAMRFKLPPDYRDINKVIVLGMGGSAIGGELALGLVAGKAFTAVQRDYTLPCPLDEHTLVIASSYSGETEETLTAFGAALDCKAKTVAVTTGGKLKAIAERRHVPIFPIGYQSPPRAALAHSMMPILAVLTKIGLLPDLSADVAEAGTAMSSLAQRIGEQSPLTANPAKRLAGQLHGHVAVIYGAEFLSGVARRWKTQINENSKAWAFFEVLPEFNHNAVVGYEHPGKHVPQPVPVMLSSNLLSPRLQKRIEVTGSIMARAGLTHELVSGEGKAKFAQMMGLILFGDYVSFYLALLNRVDPTPVNVIDFLKKSLA